MKKKHVMRYVIGFFSIALLFTSCSEEEDGIEELDMTFISTDGYTFTDATLPSGSAVKIGIVATTEKAKDPLIKFNISESIDGADPLSIYTEDINTVTYNYDFDFTLSEISGGVHLYTFTITNRDGIYLQKKLTITVE